jgi:hypothetical protein
VVILAKTVVSADCSRLGNHGGRGLHVQNVLPCRSVVDESGRAVRVTELVWFTLSSEFSPRDFRTGLQHTKQRNTNAHHEHARTPECIGGLLQRSIVRQMGAIMFRFRCVLLQVCEFAPTP